MEVLIKINQSLVLKIFLNFKDTDVNVQWTRVNIRSNVHTLEYILCTTSTVYIFDNWNLKYLSINHPTKMKNVFFVFDIWEFTFEFRTIFSINLFLIKHNLNFKIWDCRAAIKLASTFCSSTSGHFVTGQPHQH